MQWERHKDEETGGWYTLNISDTTYSDVYLREGSWKVFLSFDPHVAETLATLDGKLPIEDVLVIANLCIGVRVKQQANRMLKQAEEIHKATYTL